MTIAALQTQLRELSIVLAQLESARATLLPPAPSTWFGAARHLYDSALDGLVMTTEAGVAAVRSARDRTGSALDWMRSHA